MLSLLYPISYLLSLTGLILWFYFKDNRSVSRNMSALFLLSFLVYLFSLAFTEASLSYKLLILFRDMLILGVVSQLFNYLKPNAMVLLVAAVVIYGLIQFVGFNMLYNTFPEYTPSITETNKDFELLVETKDGTIPSAYERLINKYGLVIEPAFAVGDHSLSRLDEFLTIGIPDDAENKTGEIIRELKRISGTEYIEYNEVVQLELRPGEASPPVVQAAHVNDPFTGRQWGWDAIQGDRLHDILTSSGVKPVRRASIAILDSGVDALHEDLRAQFQSNGPANDTDPLGHGTHCAGIAAAVSNNGLGVASLIPDASYVMVTSIKVMNASGIGSERTIIQGIIKAADAGADVISMSLGSISSDSRQKAYEEAVRYANAKGAIVIAAAGNSSQNAKNYSPANARGLITVAALGTDERKAPFSNIVKDLSYGISAPGVKILSTYPNQQYKELDGTSMATPMVAGLVGLMKAFRPELTTQEVHEILYETGKSLPDGEATGRMIQSADAIERVLD